MYVSYDETVNHSAGITVLVVIAPVLSKADYLQRICVRRSLIEIYTV